MASCKSLQAAILARLIIQTQIPNHTVKVADS
jgi:hypothetical protein